jgi:hypothetical protein
MAMPSRAMAFMLLYKRAEDRLAGNVVCSSHEPGHPNANISHLLLELRSIQLTLEFQRQRCSNTPPQCDLTGGHDNGPVIGAFAKCRCPSFRRGRRGCKTQQESLKDDGLCVETQPSRISPTRRSSQRHPSTVRLARGPPQHWSLASFSCHPRSNCGRKNGTPLDAW